MAPPEASTDGLVATYASCTPSSPQKPPCVRIDVVLHPWVASAKSKRSHIGVEMNAFSDQSHRRYNIQEMQEFRQPDSALKRKLKGPNWRGES